MMTRRNLVRGSFALVALWVIAMAAADEKAKNAKTSPSQKKEKRDWITDSGGPPPELRGGNFKPTGKITRPRILPIGTCCLRYR